MLGVLFSISFIQNVAIFIYSIRNDLENLVRQQNAKFVQTSNQIDSSEIRPSNADHIYLVNLPLSKSNRHPPIRPTEAKPLTLAEIPIRVLPPTSSFCQNANQSECSLLGTRLSNQTNGNINYVFSFLNADTCRAIRPTKPTATI